MTKRLEFRQEQRGVARAAGAALVITILVLGIAAIGDHTATAMPFVDRLQSAIRVDLFVIIWLVAAIGNVARLRFFSESDIAGRSAEGASEAVRKAGAILQNTFEQVSLAIMTHMIVAATFNRSIVTVTTLAALFSIGRLLFWVGYKRGARGRAFGFGLTFYPSILALIASAAASAVG